MDSDITFRAPAPSPRSGPAHMGAGGALDAGDPFGEPRRKAERGSSLRRRLGSAFAALAAVLAKFFTAIKAAVLLLPKLKVLATAGTALVSVAAYSLWFGWTFAVGFVILIFVHEMGHVIQLRREGVRASAPMFIPFLGAVVQMREMPKDALSEAKVGLAGPVLGSAGAAVCLVIGEVANSDFFRALAYVGFFLNLFNLLPVLPLDGGRAMAAMAPWVWFVGFGALVAAIVLFPNPILLVILVIGGFEFWRRWKARKTRSLEQAAYFRVSRRNRLLVGAVYVGLIVALALGMEQAHILYSGLHSFGRL